MSAKLSVCMAALNESHLIPTLKAIRETAGNKVDIIVVDDCSDVPVEIPAEYNVNLIRNKERIGAGASKHLAALNSTTSHVTLWDAHMNPEPGWYEKAMRRISPDDRWNVVHCGSCCGLDTADFTLEEFERSSAFIQVGIGQRCLHKGTYGRRIGVSTFQFEQDGKKMSRTVKADEQVIIPASSRYYGASLNLFGPNPKKSDEFQVLEGVWAEEKPGDDYEISCLMGACYFFSRKWYDYIRGLNGNKHWGSEEPLLTLKTYLAGGSVRIMKGVRIGHKFHSGSIPYTLYYYWKSYNKIRTILTTMNEQEAKKLLGYFQNSSDINVAMDQIKADRMEIEDDYNYNQSIFVSDLEQFCQKFGIKHPLK